MKKVILFIATLLFVGGCGGTTHKKNSINMADYLPSLDTTKSFLTITQTDTNNRHLYEESITIDHNTIFISRDDDLSDRRISINDNDIREKNLDTNQTKVLRKNISEGDILYTLPKVTKIEDIKLDDIILGTKKIESTTKCKLEKKLDKLEDYKTIGEYQDDILKFKCIEEKKIVTHVKDDLPDYINLTNGEEKSDYDISYFYMKKNIGLIVKINDDCLVKNSEGVTRISDSSKICDDEHYSHTFFLE